MIFLKIFKNYYLKAIQILSSGYPNKLYILHNYTVTQSIILQIPVYY